MSKNQKITTAAACGEPEIANRQSAIGNPQELYPGYLAEKAALEERGRLAGIARSNPLPGPLREAYAGEPRVVCGFTLQPVTMGLQALLVRINSPLLEVVRTMREELTREDGMDESTPELASQVRAQRMERATKRIGALNPPQEAAVETVFCFVRPQAELRKALDAGRAAFREGAMQFVADKLHPLQFAELQRAVAEHYAASFATVVNYAAPKGKDDGTVFTPPPAETTVSAGGSRSSEPSCATFI
ncbi:MAG: hypothetical protein ABSE16_08430 [Verrucomicrobiota bacterium]|jgi:hypothetical protein